MGGLRGFVRKRLACVLSGVVLGAGGLVVSSVAGSHPGDEEVVGQVQYHQGIDEERVVDVGGAQRRYRIHVPGGVFRVDEVVPVVFAAHYYGASAEVMQKVTGFDDVAAVVVYLQGVGDAWAPAPYAGVSGEDDLAYFDAVLGEVGQEFVVDPAKTFVAGFSNGGGFAMFLRCQRPDVLGGVATVAAAFYDEVFEGCGAVAVPHVDVHGGKDPLLAYEGGVRYGHRYLGVDEVMGRIAGFNGCVDFVDSDVGVFPGRRRDWESCVGGLRQVKLVDAGHEWGVKGKFDSSPRFATREIVEFFGLSFGK